MGQASRRPFARARRQRLLSTRQRKTLRLGGELLESRSLLSVSAPVITEGPMSGAVTAQAARVFVRIDAPASVEVEYSRQADFSSSKRTEAVATTATHDFTAILSLEDLSAERQYFYRVLINGAPQPESIEHSFVTFAAPGTQRDFSFAVVSDVQDASLSPNVGAPVYAQVAADDPAFVMQIGDFDHRNPTTLTQMRAMHRDLLGPSTAQGNDLATQLAPRFPIFHVYDDHDYGVDDGDKTFPGRSQALRAFQEYYPAKLVNPAAGVWQHLADAQADLFMLDARSQRDPNSTPNGPDKSMLEGDPIANGQKEWLKTGLLSSTAVWKFIVSPVPFNPFTKPHDAWGAFGTERQEILDFVRDNHITGVIIISGDLHTGGAIDDGTNSGLPEISVPHTNLILPPTQPTSGAAGIWSQGLLSGIDNPGYTLVHVQADPAQVLLEAKGVDGTVRKSLVIALPPAIDHQGPLTNQLVILPATASSGPTFSARLSDFASGGRNIVAAEMFLDQAGPVGTGTPLPAQDGRYNGPSEGISGALSAAKYASLAPGVHTIFVRSRDEAGNWGPLAYSTFTKAAPPVTSQTFYLSTANAGQLHSSNGVALGVADADIVKLVARSDGPFQFSLHFDGSDVGLTTATEDIDAFAFLPDGSIVLSTVGAFSVRARYTNAGLPLGGTITGNGSDLLRFTPTKLGSATAGSWSVYVRGGTVGLSGPAENLDGVSVLSDGRILVSTTGTAVVGTVTAGHEDIVAYQPSNRTWQMYFDASDVSPAAVNEDLDAMYLGPAATAGGLPTIYLSTRTSAVVPQEDVERFVPTALGNDTAGVFDAAPALDGSRFGLTALGVDGIAVNSPVAASVAIAAVTEERPAQQVSVMAALPASEDETQSLRETTSPWTPIERQTALDQWFATPAAASPSATGSAQNSIFGVLADNERTTRLPQSTAPAARPTRVAAAVSGLTAPRIDRAIVGLGDELDALLLQ